MKTCTKCKTTYTDIENNFNKCKSIKGGYTYHCKSCAKKASKEHYKKNRLEKSFMPNRYFIGKVNKALGQTNADTIEVVLYIVETSLENMYYFCEVMCYKNNGLPTTIVGGDKYYLYTKVDEICNNYLSNLYYIYQNNKSFKIIFREIKGKEIRSNIFKGE